jgi:hypothetical protein
MPTQTKKVTLKTGRMNRNKLTPLALTAVISLRLLTDENRMMTAIKTAGGIIRVIIKGALAMK